MNCFNKRDFLIILHILFIMGLYSIQKDNTMKSKQLVYDNLIPINSLDLSQDMNDMSFLKDTIRDSRIVLLGEQDHGDGTTFLLKAKIVKYLHENMDFNVLAFESDFYECNTLSEGYASEDNDFEALKNSLFIFWRYGKNIHPFYDYIQSQKDRPITITGFDNKHLFKSPAALEQYIKFIQDSIPDKFKGRVNDTNLLDTVRSFESGEIENRPTFYSDLNTTKTLLEEIANDNNAKGFFKQELNNLISNIKVTMTEEWDKQLIIRDNMMADNVKWLLENKFPNEKIIIWAHNQHIVKDYKDCYSPETVQEFVDDGDTFSWVGELMGERLYKEYGEDVYSIGTISYSGEYNPMAFQGNFDIREAIMSEQGSLESIIHDRNLQYGFLKLQGLDSDFILTSVDCHNEPCGVKISKLFNALLYIDVMECIE